MPMLFLLSPIILLPFPLIAAPMTIEAAQEIVHGSGGGNDSLIQRLSPLPPPDASTAISPALTANDSLQTKFYSSENNFTQCENNNNNNNNSSENSSRHVTFLTDREKDETIGDRRRQEQPQQQLQQPLVKRRQKSKKAIQRPLSVPGSIMFGSKSSSSLPRFLSRPRRENNTGFLQL